ncbi:MAG: hypothetical protein ACOCV4_03070 [Myxococcota bacterium]
MSDGETNLMSTQSRGGAVLVAALLLFVCDAGAQDDPRQSVPPELEPWVPWVLAGVPDHGCPVTEDGTVCTWAGRLRLELGERGGSFVQQGVTDREAWLALPGDGGHWPQQVRVDGREVPVLEREGRPAVRLEAGSHRIEGRLVFERLPEVLPVPLATALVDLVLEGEAVPSPRREADGTLWLRRQAAGADGEARLELRVARKVSDGVPVRVTTRLDLEVGGRPREVDLGPVGVPGTVPIRVDADVPARIDGEGHLVVQVVAGEHTVELQARAEGRVEGLQAPAHGEPWPEHEIWVWEGDEELRQVDLRGAPAIDPARTHLDEDWASLPAYVLEPEAELAIGTVRRGEPEPPPNRLKLERELWLDLDGAGYTVRDRVSGSMRRDWRLDLVADGELGHVTVHDQDRLITRAPQGDASGVELRRSDLGMVAEWRLPDERGDLPAVGWSSDVQQLSWRLHLPPGWSVLSASGVDEMSGTWLGSWNLFDFFFVLVLSLAVARLLGWPFGVVALVLLALSHQEPGAPHWTWASLLAAVALLRVLPKHWTRGVVRGWWAVTVAILAALAVPFAVAQVRQAIHPQVAESHRDVGFVRQAMAPPGAAMDEDVSLEAAAEEGEAAAAGLDSAAGERYAQKAETERKPKKLALLEQDPSAVIQTGPGVPAWSWRTWSLSWSGPVERDQRVELFLLSPWVNGLLAVLRVALMFLLGVVLVGRSWPRGGGDRSSRASGTLAAAAAMMWLTLGLAGAARAQPVTPPEPPAPEPDILAELRERLTRAADCRPDCVAAPSAELSIEADRLALSAEVHAGEASSFRLPGPASQWVPAEVRLDGSATTALALRDDGYIHVRVPAGTHRIEIAGPVVSDALTLQLPDRVRRFAVGPAEGWAVDGIGEDGRATGQVRLTRVRPAGAEDDGGDVSAALPPWLHVRRRLEAGVGWRLRTVVRRVSPAGSPVRVRVPLLEGESVQRSDLAIEDGHAVVALGDDQEELEWRSTLEPRSELAWKAPEGVPWTETWDLACGPVWRCEPGDDAEGAPPPVGHVDEGRWQPTYRPWPGEQLAMRFARPDAAEGRAITVDSAELVVHPGARLERSTLTLRVRSSSGGVQAMTVPEGARVQSLTVDGEARPFRRQDRTLEVGLSPGVQVIAVEWQRSEGMGVVHHAPAVELGGPATNAEVTLHVPPERWLLGVAGPSWGPTVLFWSYLLVVVLLALLLSRVPGSPLRFWQWGLLGVGLTQVHPVAALGVVGWFFALRWRRARPLARKGTFDLVQLLLVVGTVAALGVLYTAVHRGLLVQPDMQVAGARSTQTALRWYVDRVEDVLPTPVVWSVPLWIWKVLMLLWSLWLAWSLVRWLPWAWRCFSEGGLWKRLRRPKPKGPPRGAAPSAAAPASAAGAEAPAGPPSSSGPEEP